MQATTKVAGLVGLAVVLVAEGLLLHQPSAGRLAAEGVALISVIAAFVLNRKNNQGESSEEY